MKSYRSAREVLAAVERALSADEPTNHAETLQQVTRILHDQRHYWWAGIYLVFGNQAVRVAYSGPEPKHEPCATIALGRGNVGGAAQDGHVRVVPNVDDDEVYLRALDETKSEIATPIKLAGRVIGVINIESERENGLAAEDRVLQKDVAAKLARFLTGRGKYIVRKFRGGLARPETERGHQPSSEKPEYSRRAAAGEKTR